MVIYGESWPQRVKDEEKIAYIFLAQRTKCLLLRWRLQSAYCHVHSYSPFAAQRQLHCVQPNIRVALQYIYTVMRLTVPLAKMIMAVSIISQPEI